MPNDPLSHVASWIASAPPELAENSAGTDPLIALIRERDRLFKVATKLDERADAIRRTLPEAVQEGKVLMTLADFDEPIDFKTEENVNTFVLAAQIIGLKRRWVPHWDRLVEQMLTDFRTAKKNQIDDVLEASGVAALLREATELNDQADELDGKICQTPASSFEVLFWQLERARDFEDDDLLDTIVAGVKRLAGSECNTELEELMKAERSPQNAGEPDSDNELLSRAAALLPLYLPKPAEGGAA